MSVQTKSERPCWWRMAVAPGTVRVATVTALVVGPILTAINQWGALTGGADLNWIKVALTFAVPYAVSTVSAALNACRDAAGS
ncbi:nitrate/nitrite transporter NrtS [Limimonas halophila]|nr:nitrate/nitrite transporter NrtS [Limimonas halophila]